MAIQKWDPFFEIGRINNEIDRLFGNWPARGNGSVTSSCAVPVDIMETPGEVVIRAELPGIDPSEVEVRVEDGVLTIAGEKKLEPVNVGADGEEGQEQAEYLRVERYFGKFTRSFVVPRYVDATRVDAEYKNGLLTLKLPRREETQPKRIEVKVAAR